MSNKTGKNDAQAMRKSLNAGDRDQTLVKMMGGVALAAALIIGLRTQSWALGIAVFVTLFASTYLRGRLAVAAAFLVGAGCAWAVGLLGYGMLNAGGAVAGAILGFVVGAGAHVGAQNYARANSKT